MIPLANNGFEENVLALSTGPENRVAWVGKSVHDFGVLCVGQVSNSEQPGDSKLPLTIIAHHKTKIEVTKAVHWDIENSVIYEGSFQGVLTAHDTTGQNLRSLPVSKSPIHQIQHHSSEAVIATGKGEIVCYDIRCEQPHLTIIPTTTSKSPECWTVRTHPSLNTVLAGYSDGSICQFDLRGPSVAVAQAKLSAGICSVDLTSENKAFVSAADGSIAYYNFFETPKQSQITPNILQHKAHGDTGTLWSVRGTKINNKPHLLSCGSKGDVKLWEVKETGQNNSLAPISTLLVSSHAIVCMETFSSNPNVIVYSSLDRKVCLRATVKPVARNFSAPVSPMPSEKEIPDDNLSRRFTGDLSKLLKQKQYRYAERRAQEFLSRYHPTQHIFNEILHLYCLVGDERNALKVLEEMKLTPGICPDAYTYNHLIKMYGDKRNAEKARQFFEVMKSEGIEMNPITENNMLRVLARNGLYEEAEAFFSQISNPTIVTYQILLNMYADLSMKEVTDKNKIEDIMYKANKVIKKMKKSGIPLETKMYNLMLKLYAGYYGRKGDTLPVLELYKEMSETKIKPDIITYNTLVNMYSLLGSDAGIQSCLESMTFAGFKPDVATYSSIIGMYAKLGKMTEVRTYLKEMKKEGIYPSVEIYTQLINFYCDIKHVVHASKSLYAMIRAGMKPSRNLFAKFSARQGRPGQAFAIHRQMKDSGWKMDMEIYHALLKMAMKNQLIPEAMRLYSEMTSYKNDDHIPRFYSIPEADGSEERRPNPNYIEPNDETFTLLVQLLAPKYSLDLLTNVLTDMQHAHLPINKKIISIILRMREDEPSLSEEGIERVKWLKSTFAKEEKPEIQQIESHKE